MPSPKWLVRLLGRLANGHFLVRHGRIASATARKSSPGPYGLCTIFDKELRKRNEKYTFQHAFNHKSNGQGGQSPARPGADALLAPDAPKRHELQAMHPN